MGGNERGRDLKLTFNRCNRISLNMFLQFWNFLFSVAAGLRADQCLAVGAFAELFAVVLANLCLQAEVIPRHVGLDEVGDGPDDTGQQANVDAILSHARHVKGKVLVQLM